MDRVEIIEVGARDGLQNDPAILAPGVRADLVRRLLDTGVSMVEAVSFVSPRRVPQMAGAEEVLAAVGRGTDGRLTALIPNHKGYERARDAGLRRVRCVVAASATMNRVNFGIEPEGTLDEIARIAGSAAGDGVTFGVVIGTAFGCPFEGAVAPQAVMAIAVRVAELGADEVVLADTTGVANPAGVHALASRVLESGVPRPACHFHNTRNTGFANVVRALDAGVRRFDASVGGTGGCPFAPRATGNVATEDLVHMLTGMGVRTDVDLDAMVRTAAWLQDQLGHDLPGLVMRAGPAWALASPPG